MNNTTLVLGFAQKKYLSSGPDVLKSGDIITITAGMPVGHVNYTNTLRVHQLTELSFAPFVQD